MLKYLKEKTGGETLKHKGDEAESSMAERQKRKIKVDWMEDDQIKPWAEKRETEVYCRVCKVSLKDTAGKSDLISHSKTSKHLESSKAILFKQPKIDQVFCDNKILTKKAEVKLAVFIVEHNLAFAVGDHVAKMCRNVFPDSEVSANVTLGRKKANAIVKNVVGSLQFSNVCEFLRNNYFLLCADESTDISNVKYMCLVVRLSIDFEVMDLFFGLLTVNKCDADSLYNLIVNHFNENKIDYKKNLIGFAADGAPVMSGKKHSVAELLKRDVPNLFIIKCVCHSFALCSSYACLKLPSAVETLVRNVYNYLCNSPKRSKEFNDIQMLLEIKPKQLLHPSQTRWLSLEAVVVRVFELYEPLKIYFAFAVNADEIDTSKYIFENLNETNLIYLAFLKYALSIINTTNKIFQSETTEIHILYREMVTLLIIIISNFISNNFIARNNIVLTDYKKTSNMLNYNKIYLGLYASEILLETILPQHEIDEIKMNCINFYIELCDQILKRFEFENKFKSLNLINPNVLINGPEQSFSIIVKGYQHFIEYDELQSLDSEFREVSQLDFRNIFNSNNEELLKFWKTVCELRRADSKLLFPVLTKFIKKILILPHSSANVERAFSQVNLNKNKYRNRLERDSMEGILFTKDFLKLNKANCYDLKEKPEALKKFNNDMYLNNGTSA